jgi:regulatory protein RepA
MIIKATPKLQLPPIDVATNLLANPNLPVPPEIVHGLLHQGTKGVVASSSKGGKTWVLLDLAASIATGTNFLKWPTTQGKVLFVNLEIQRAFIKDRLRVIKERKQLSNLDNLEIWTLRG